jgi:hypothetical protein
MAFFGPDGQKVAGRLAFAQKGVPRDEIATEVAEAVGRCQNNRYTREGRALKELKRLFETYPLLKRDAWGVGEHPVSPLIDLYVKELFG